MTVRKTAAGSAAPPPVAAPAAPEAIAAGDGANGYHVVRSKWVATFYRAPSPQAPAFVEIGDKWRPGRRSASSR